VKNDFEKIYQRANIFIVLNIALLIIEFSGASSNFSSFWYAVLGIAIIINTSLIVVALLYYNINRKKK